MNSAARLTGSSSLLGRAVGLVVLRRCCQRVMLRPCHLFSLVDDLPGHELVHEQLRVGLRHGRGVHLDVAVELRVGVGVGDVGGEEHRRRDRLQLQVDAGLLAGLLDDCLGLLARRVDRGLVDELQLLAVLRADAVGAALPAAGVEDLVRLVDVELPLHVLRAEPLRVVEEVRRGDAGAAVDVLLHRLAVDQQVERLAHRRVGEQRVLRLEARALAVDLGPGIGGVELDVLDVAARA